LPRKKIIGETEYFFFLMRGGINVK